MNPIQLAIEALERIADPRNKHFSGDAQVVAQEALTSLRSLQKEVEGVELPEPAFKLYWRGDLAAYKVSKPNIGDTDVYTADQLRTAVAAALGRGVVNSGWCVTSEELAQWTDAYAAFKGAFDTPQMRRQFNDEYAEDARHRLREFNERMLSAAPTPEASQPTQAEVPSEREAFEAFEAFEAALRSREGPAGDTPGYPGEAPFFPDQRDAALWGFQAALQWAASQQAAERVPLTDEQLRAMHHEDEFGLFCDFDEFEQIARAVEQAHRITATSGKESGND